MTSVYKALTRVSATTAMALLLFLNGGAAVAETGYAPGLPRPGSKNLVPFHPVAPRPSTVHAAGTASRGIAFTGMDVFRWVLIVVGLVAAGTALLMVERRRSRSRT